MLDPWIIEEILRREQRQRREERPVLEMPLTPPSDERERDGRKEESDRGIAIVDFRIWEA